MAARHIPVKTMAPSTQESLAEPDGVGPRRGSLAGSAARGRDGETVRIDTADTEAAASAPTPEPAGSALRFQFDYRVLREIGRGGMSVVHLAMDQKLGRCVALKRLSEKYLSNLRIRERFFREARSIASLSHLHIVHVYGVEEDEEGPFIVMEYVVGPGKPMGPGLPAAPLNLDEKVEKLDGPLPPRAAVEVVRKLCRAVHYAHTRGVIHRDLKPSNVLLDESGEPKIVDFGLARIASAAELKLTLAGARILSLGYAAPEQEEDMSTVDERADIYGLGAILYFCLTGENPRFFREGRVPVHLRPPLLKALENDRDLRWRTAKEFEEALTQCEGSYASPKTEVGMWRCKWCSALNPFESRYCAECGWDGLEKCPECGGETRVGVRFCGGCGTDIKAFEDMEGLLARLKDYRQRKDFERLAKEAQGASRFQARGEAGTSLVRQIAELIETANWAVTRKQELRHAISTELERENYEQVRDRVSEFDVLDGGDPYRDLRLQLPWKIAERDINRLKAELEEARALLAQKRPNAGRKLIEEVKTRRSQVHRLEAQFPLLKGRLGVSDVPGRPAEDNELTQTLKAVDAGISALDGQMADVEKRIQTLVQEAEVALKAQDYAQCLAKGEEIRQLTAEPTPADAFVSRSSASARQIADHLKRAEEAIGLGRFDVAERICGGILDRLQHDSADALQLLSRIGWKRRRRNALTVVAAAACAVILYMMSVGPVFRLAARMDPDRPADGLKTFYAPIVWLHDNGVLRRPLEWYARWWGAHPFQTPAPARGRARSERVK